LKFASDAGNAGLGAKLKALNKEVSGADSAATKLENKRYFSDGRQALADNDAQAAKDLREGVKNQRAQSANLSKLQTGLSENAGQMITDLKGLFYPKDEVDSLISKFEAADTVFVSIAGRIRAHKERLAHLIPDLFAVLSQIATIQAQIAAAHQHEADLYETLIGAEQRMIPANIKGIADGLAGSALQDLIKERYLLVKAYEALFLKPLSPGDLHDPNSSTEVQPLDVAALFELVKTNVAAAQSDIENPSDHEDFSPEREAEVYDTYAKAMKTLLQGLSTQIAKVILDRAREGRGNLAPNTPTDVKLTLSKSQLRALNTAPVHRAFVDLSRLTGMVILDDRTVIEDIKVTSFEFAPAVDQHTTTLPKFTIRHNGSGVMKSQNKLWMVRYGQGEELQTWSYQADISDPKHQELTHNNDIQRSGAESALLKEAQGILSDGSDDTTDAASFFTKLPAFTELVFELEKVTGLVPPEIMELTLTLTVNSVSDQGTTLVLDLSVDDTSDGQLGDLRMPVQVSTDSGESWSHSTLPLLLPVQDGSEVHIRSGILAKDGIVQIEDLDDGTTIAAQCEGYWRIPMNQTNGESTVRTLKASIGKVAKK